MSMRPPGQKTKFYLQISAKLGAIFVFALVLTKVLLYSQNTLYLNNHWQVEKRFMEMSVMSANEFLILRNTLAQNQLHLDAWWGHHLVFYETKLGLRRLKARVKVARSAYIELLYNRTAEGHSGIRLSADSPEKSFHFKSDLSGKFVARGKLKSAITPDTWHDLELLQSKDGLALEIDGRPADRLPNEKFLYGQFGIGSGENAASVEAVQYTDGNNNAVTEDFVNRKNQLKIFAALSALLMIISSALSLLFKEKKEAVLALLMVLITGSIVFSFYYAFDFYFWSEKPFLHRTRNFLPGETVSTEQKIDNIRYGIFEKLNRIFGGEEIAVSEISKRGYPSGYLVEGPIYCKGTAPCSAISAESLAEHFREKKSGHRILFVGTSQTVGAGARNLSETFFSRVHFGVQAALKPGNNLESVNMSISGSQGQELFVKYVEKYVDFRPDLVVINLSNNDAEDQLKDRILSFVKFNKEKKISTILLGEPTDFSSTMGGGTKAKNQIMADVATEQNCPYFSITDYINEAEVADSGHLWWDYVHMSSYAQGIYADWLIPKIRAVLVARGAVD